MLNLMSSLSAGSKEDAFFDSKPWLDSDCDDDFFSVNGGMNLLKFLVSRKEKEKRNPFALSTITPNLLLLKLGPV